jgi:hypothetical protein
MSASQKFTATVNVSISDFDTDDIIDYLRDECFLNADQIETLQDIIDEKNIDIDKEVVIKPKTLADRMKLELIAEVFDKYSQAELERRLS